MKNDRKQAALLAPAMLPVLVGLFALRDHHEPIFGLPSAWWSGFLAAAAIGSALSVIIAWRKQDRSGS